MNDIIENILNGDRKSSSEFFYRYRNYVRRIVCGYKKNDDIDDCVMLIFERIFKYIGGLTNRDEYSLLAWIKMISINVCKSEFEFNKKYRNNVDISNASHISSSHNSNEKIIGSINFEKYMTDKEYSVFVRYYFKNMHHSDIAKELNLTVSNTKTLLSRGVSKIRNNKKLKEILYGEIC